MCACNQKGLEHERARAWRESTAYFRTASGPRRPGGEPRRQPAKRREQAVSPSSRRDAQSIFILLIVHKVKQGLGVKGHKQKLLWAKLFDSYKKPAIVNCNSWFFIA